MHYSNKIYQRKLGHLKWKIHYLYELMNVWQLSSQWFSNSTYLQYFFKFINTLIQQRNYYKMHSSSVRIDVKWHIILRHQIKTAENMSIIDFQMVQPPSWTAYHCLWGILPSLIHHNVILSELALLLVLVHLAKGYHKYWKNKEISCTRESLMAAILDLYPSANEKKTHVFITLLSVP